MKRGSFLMSLLSAPALAQGSSVEQRMRTILPSEDEWRWMQIPWRTNVMQALAESGRAGKPVLLWVMNGNPLGCG